MKRLFILMLCAMLLCGCTVAPIAAEDVPIESEATEAPEDEPLEEDIEAYEITYKNAVSYTNSIGTVWIQGIVEITNTGTVALYLSSGTLDYEDAAGNLITTETYVSAYPSIIQPGEKGYMYSESMYSGDQPDTVVVLPHPDVKKAKVDDVRYSVSEDELYDDAYFGLKMKGRVENTDDETGSMIYIVAVLYDAEGVPIGILMTILTDDLATGGKIGFELSSLALPPTVTLDSVDSYAVYAYPMIMQF